MIKLKYVLDALRKREVEEKLPVIQMEIDYELVTLHDALKEGNQEEIEKTKVRLEKLRQEMLELA